MRTYWAVRSKGQRKPALRNDIEFLNVLRGWALEVNLGHD